MKITAKDIYDLIKGNKELSDTFISDKKEEVITIDDDSDYEYDENKTFDDGDDDEETCHVDCEGCCHSCHSVDEDFKQVEEDFKPESKKDKKGGIAFIESFIRDQGYTSENGVLKNEFGDYLGKKDLLDFLKYLGK